jgi:RimJ/RimL family protein N-acetyltransferase
MEQRVSLRPVKIDDLPIFFVHQLDPEATKLAAFPSRDQDVFFTHWTANILGNPATVNRTVLAGDQVAGYIGAWTDATSNGRLICYWIVREFWNRGIASAAMLQFLRLKSTRPLSAHVAKHNFGSIRVLEKAGFSRVGEDGFSLPSGARQEEFIYVLAA